MSKKTIAYHTLIWLLALAAPCGLFALTYQTNQTTASIQTHKDGFFQHKHLTPLALLKTQKPPAPFESTIQSTPVASYNEKNPSNPLLLTTLSLAASAPESSAPQLLASLQNVQPTLQEWAPSELSLTTSNSTTALQLKLARISSTAP